MASGGNAVRCENGALLRTAKICGQSPATSPRENAKIWGRPKTPLEDLTIANQPMAKAMRYGSLCAKEVRVEYPSPASRAIKRV